jgi:hypothetical protein
MLLAKFSIIKTKNNILYHTFVMDGAVVTKKEAEIMSTTVKKSGSDLTNKGFEKMIDEIPFIDKKTKWEHVNRQYDNRLSTNMQTNITNYLQYNYYFRTGVIDLWISKIKKCNMRNPANTEQ